MNSKISIEEQMNQLFGSILTVALEAIVEYVNTKDIDEEVTLERLREVIGQPTDKTVSIIISGSRPTKEVPPEKRCCRIITGKSARDICGKQISSQGGIFCAGCRKLKTLNVLAKDILEDRGLTLWEATGGFQGVDPNKKKSKKYEESEDEDEENSEEEDEEEEEDEKPKKTVKKQPPVRLVDAAKRKRVVRNK